jgi:hypothetical protein
MKIKNKFWLTVCFLTLFSFARAEKTTNNYVHFMLCGGFNSSKTIMDLNSKHSVMSEAKQNYNFGAGFRINLGTALFVQPEVYFTRKGGLSNVFRPNASDTVDQHLVDMQSIDMPIMVGIRLFPGDGFCFRAYGGPVISFLRDPSVNIDRNGQLRPRSLMDTKTKAFSVQMGAGFDITRRFTFDARYEYAFSPMFKISDLKTKYRIFYFTVGIKLF